MLIGSLCCCSGFSASSSTVLSSTTSTGILQSGIPIDIIAPADGATIYGKSVIVQGKTTAGAVVSVNGNPVIADINGVFEISIDLEEGINPIDVIATDDNNNQGEFLLLVSANP
jgi:hypothetical protein